MEETRNHQVDALRDIATAIETLAQAVQDVAKEIADFPTEGK